MARKKKEQLDEFQPQCLTQSELAELADKHHKIESAALKVEICKLRGVVLQLQTQEELRKIQEVSKNQTKEHDVRKSELKALCNELGRKYDVDFAKISYDDVTGEIKQF